MNFFPRVFSHEDEGKLRKLTFLRLVVATAVVGAAIMVLQIDYKMLSVVALYILLGVIYLSTGSVYLAFKSGVPFRPVLKLQICIDLVVLTMIVHYGGGSDSPLTILYILPIIIGGIYFHVIGGLVTAILATAAYVVYTALEVKGHIRPMVGGLTIPAQGIYRPFFLCYLHMVIFTFTGLLSGYVSRLMRSKGEELADRERKLRHIQLNTDNIIRNMSSGLIVTNMCGEILSLNPAALSILGLDRQEDYEGKLIETVIPHMPVLVKELSYFLETGMARKRHELVVEREDRGVLPLGISISILRGEGGEKEGVIALFQDLTEVHRMREKVRQADKMAAIGELSAAIAHEIRAPLASVCGSIEMLSRGLEFSGDNRKLMDIIIKESDRLDRIITDFLEFARPKRPEFAPVEIGLCVNDVVALLQHSSSGSGNISIDILSNVNGMQIYADEEQIRQVFLNIGLNACEAMGHGGNLTIRVGEDVQRLRESDPPVECVKVDFKNDGPLISQDVILQVFEPFYTTKEGGTGLGLATAMRIIDSHAGLIKVESTEEGGTVFSVFIPLHAVPVDERKESLQEEYICF